MFYPESLIRTGLTDVIAYFMMAIASILLIGGPLYHLAERGLQKLVHLSCICGNPSEVDIPRQSL